MESGAEWMVDHFFIVIILVSSLSLLIYFLGNSQIAFLAPEVSPLLLQPLSFSWFSKSSAQSSRLVALFFPPSECFLIPRLQAFVSIY